jgi:uncharacterized protein (UPF0332 family)
MSSAAVTVAGYMRKAERALDEARLLLRERKTEGACSRAYYAMHDAAHAALFATGHEASAAPIKTHHGLIAAFGKELVLGGRIDAAVGRAFNKVQDMRQLADYSAEPPALDDAQSAIEQAEAFVAAIRSMIGALKP